MQFVWATPLQAPMQSTTLHSTPNDSTWPEQEQVRGIPDLVARARLIYGTPVAEPG